MTEDVRPEVFALLEQHGYNSISFQVLESGFSYWFDALRAGCIAYADTGTAWVVAGAPIAPPERWPALVEDFRHAAVQARRRVVCFAVEQRFSEATGWPALQIGEQPVWEPTQWQATLATVPSLRRQVKRAVAKGVQVRMLDSARLLDSDAPERHAIEQLIARWRQTRGMAPMGFLVRVEPFVFSHARRYWGAYQGDKLVGFLSMVPIYARRGWLIDDLLRDPAAPNGTVELLVDAAMGAAAASGSAYVTLGLAPLAGSVSAWLRRARRLAGGLYDFRGLRAFKAKLRPAHWVPIFVAAPPGQSAWRTVYDVLVAFTPHGLWRFAWDTLRRGPTALVQALTVLLIPWTIALAAVDANTWFPAPWVQRFWVAFDIGLLAGLLVLCQRWRPRLATVLATAITGDAVVTLAEALWFAQPPGLVGDIVRASAVLAPTLAAGVLWAARARRAAGLQAPAKAERRVS